MTDQAISAASSSVDLRLQTLLELWDRLDEPAGQPNSLGVTVMVDGTTYSGLLIAGRVWSRALADLLRAAPGNPQVSALSSFFDQITDSYEQAGDPSEARAYLHLASVSIGLPNDGKRTSLLMRIRAADVSGWTVGTIGELPPFPAPPFAAPAPAQPGEVAQEPAADGD